MKLQLWAFVACAGLVTSAIAQPPERDDFGSSAPPAGEEYGHPPGGAGGPGGPGGPPPNAMFSAIDADGDGAITKIELRKAVAALKKLDTDKDGKITLAETMAAGRAMNLNNQQGLSNQQGNLGQGGFNNGAGGFQGGGRFSGAGTGDPRQGPNLMQYDRNGDGALSPEEVPTQMMGLVRGSDQNGNGKLDPQELQAIGQRMNERARSQRSLPPGVTVGPQGVQRQPQNP